MVQAFSFFTDASMVSVAEVQVIITEGIQTFKVRLDAERDRFASQNANMIRAEITSQSARFYGHVGARSQHG